MPGPGRPRGGRAGSTAARSTRPPPTTHGSDQPLLPTNSRTTRAAAAARKRQGAADDELLPPKPAKNPRKVCNFFLCVQGGSLTAFYQNAETVHTAPLISHTATGHNTINAPTVYFASGPSSGYAHPTHNNVHISSSRLLAQPGSQPSPHLQAPGQYLVTSHHLPGTTSVTPHHHAGQQWIYPQQWPGSHSGTQPTIPLPHGSHPPPYQSPPPEVVVVDNDFSDGEEHEVEPAEDFGGEADESTGVQASVTTYKIALLTPPAVSPLTGRPS
jgi:hypothetical protein